MLIVIIMLTGSSFQALGPVALPEDGLNVHKKVTRAERRVNVSQGRRGTGQGRAW